ncbi:MAG: Uncharacterized protein G01um101413_700 [Parcubacteria group bacterium Gr01-1014_13]|nr:MAG: Uncharacterized protein G01um101413_700 [Parcubacteria group bacterium Gr01-1014_13]
MNQLELHNKIEAFFKAGLESANVKVGQDLLLNEDAKRFFFSMADEFWIKWFWKEGFFNGLKKRAVNTTQIFYTMPELEYLARIAAKDPDGVAQVIKSVEISEENFNPEVIDRFFWILYILPAEQIKSLTSKVRDERWIYLMRAFRKTGYEFEKVVSSLVEKKEGQALLELAQALLLVKSKEEVSAKDSFSKDDPFYVSDLDASGIFEALANIEEEYVERSLQLTTDVMASMVKLSDHDETKIFEYSDSFTLYDVDFFTLELSGKRSASFREDIKNLAASIKKIVERTVGKNCENESTARRFFEYINNLPSSRSMWRLKLFALSQCPNVFKEELKKAFFKVFEVGETYSEIEGGAEYHQSLKRSFKFFDKETQQKYINSIFGYFGGSLEDKDVEKWRKRDGKQILSLIKEWLTPENKSVIKDKFHVDIDSTNYIPEPTVGKARGGWVHHTSPVNIADFTIDKIITKLKSDWTAEKFEEEFKNDDFLNPRGVEGLGDALREDIKKRPNDYLESIKGFYGRESIHPHYLYSILRGIEEMLRNKQSLNLKQIGQLISLFDVIRKDGELKPFRKNKDKKDDRFLLVDWVGLHTIVADILLFTLESKETRKEVHEIYRQQSKDLISYLFTIKDSPSVDDEKPEYGELYHIAINSVRGRACEAFVVFVENDGKVLLDDIKLLYKQVLQDNSLAVRFMLGRYLASFHFRDQEFIAGLFPEIFPKDDRTKKDIYLATWEGYLSSTLYEQLFIALKDYYQYAIGLDPEVYTQRKYVKGLDETLAIHLALAFAHFNIGIDNPLISAFWKKINITRQQEFVSFIGRSCLTKDVASDKWLEENHVSKEKLINFWSWVIDNIKESGIFSGFGFWINPDREIIDDSIVVEKMADTLKKSGGDIDWDYGLLKRLPYLAEKNPEKCLEVIWYYLLDSDNKLNSFRHRGPLLYDGQIKEALSVIYKNGNKVVQEKVVKLINILIEKGSSTFWQLKEVVH